MKTLLTIAIVAVLANSACKSREQSSSAVKASEAYTAVEVERKYVESAEKTRVALGSEGIHVKTFKFVQGEVEEMYPNGFSVAVEYVLKDGKVGYVRAILLSQNLGEWITAQQFQDTLTERLRNQLNVKAPPTLDKTEIISDKKGKISKKLADLNIKYIDPVDEGGNSGSLQTYTLNDLIRKNQLRAGAAIAQRIVYDAGLKIHVPKVKIIPPDARDLSSSLRETFRITIRVFSSDGLSGPSADFDIEVSEWKTAPEPSVLAKSFAQQILEGIESEMQRNSMLAGFIPKKITSPAGP
ncbi:MAG: hypothetical protein NTV34_20160 [Proteobacteria bacterium]|nr:hypothetical protein [Pseudomonadota bacterium]